MFAIPHWGAVERFHTFAALAQARCGTSVEQVCGTSPPPSFTLWQVQAALQVLRQRMTVPQFVLRIMSGHKIMKIIVQKKILH